MCERKKMPEFNAKLLLSLSKIQWHLHVTRLKNWLTGVREKGKARHATRVPGVARKYGKDNFKYKDKKLFVFDREIVHTPERRKEIFDGLVEAYGGPKKTMSRLYKKYVGISRSMLLNRFATEERRQLKAERWHAPNQHQTFIVVDLASATNLLLVRFPPLAALLLELVACPSVAILANPSMYQ